MHFGTKSYLKSTRNHTAKHALKIHYFFLFNFVNIVFNYNYQMINLKIRIYSLQNKHAYNQLYIKYFRNEINTKS